ncbi:hypothetical protein M1563_00420 [Patescibacteria group bacterium]|nr:hypothetical protein [Patescibacteria group bacterium]
MKLIDRKRVNINFNWKIFLVALVAQLLLAYLLHLQINSTRFLASLVPGSVLIDSKMLSPEPQDNVTEINN